MITGLIQIPRQQKKEFYDQLYQPNVFGKYNSNNKVFHVPIGNTKNTEMNAFNPHVPEIKYFQDDEYTCVFGSLASALFAENENFAENAVVSQLSSYLSCDTVGFMNRINIFSDILTDCVRNKGEQ